MAITNETFSQGDSRFSFLRIRSTDKIDEVNLLLLRGWARDQRHWGEFYDIASRELAKHGHRVFRIDFPGFGTEINRNSPGRLTDIVADLRERWLKLKAEQINEHSTANAPSDNRWVVVGLSLGGMTGLQWISKHPDDFIGAVVMNASSLNLSPPWLRLRPLVFAKLIASALTPRGVDKERRILQSSTRLLGPKLERLAETFGSFYKESRPRFINILKQLVAAVFFWTPKIVGKKLLFLASKHDDLCHISCSKQLANHYRAGLRTHLLAGHDLSTDDPYWVTQEILQWIQSFQD